MDAFYTINACNRCRKRKVRCDAGIPACGPCQSMDLACESTDARAKTTQARRSIEQLEEQIARLEDAVRRAQLEGGREGRAEDDVLQSGLGGEGHFLGVSSGMHLARSVLESTHQNYSTHSRDHLSEALRSSQSPTTPTSALRPDPSYQPAFPPLETALGFIDIFFDQYLVQYPILIPSEFKADVTRFYQTVTPENPLGKRDPWMLFMLNMVFSISLAYISRLRPDTMRQAEGFSASAMTHLGAILRPKSTRSLQCLLLLLLASIVNSTSAPMWYVSGICVRMVIDLGYHSERSVQLQSARATPESIDTKRRLFWVTYSFDRTLATMLGRPFNLEDDKIDVQLPFASLPVQQRSRILQWLKLQRIQSELVHRLFTSKAASSHDPWINDTLRDLDAWLDQCESIADVDTTDIDWWTYWHHNAVLLLLRPDMASSRATETSLNRTFRTAKDMIHLAFIRINKGTTGTTCLDLHCQLMSGITLLYLVLKQPHIRARARADWLSFKSCLAEWQWMMQRSGDRWASMDRSRNVLLRLAEAAVDIVGRDAGTGQKQRDDSHLNRLQSVLDAVDGGPGVSSLATSQGQTSQATLAQPLYDIPPISNQPPTIDAPSAFADLDFSHLLSGEGEFSSDLSTFLDFSTWTGREEMDPRQAVGVWDYLQVPGAEALGLSLGQLGGILPENTFPDLVLNFHEDAVGGENDDWTANDPPIG